MRVKSTVWGELASYKYDWSGNVRELMQVINSTLTDVGGKNIKFEDFEKRLGLRRNSQSKTESSNLAPFSAQEKLILELINEFGYIQNKDIREKLGLKATSTWNLLKTMTEKGIIRTVGSGRGLKYIRNF